MSILYINLEPLIEYLTKEIKTDDLSDLLGDLIFDYTIMFFRLYELDRVNLRGNPEEYVYYLIRLRDSLAIVNHVKQKRFLGFLWYYGKKDNRVEVVSKNPNTVIEGAEYIELRE